MSDASSVTIYLVLMFVYFSHGLSYTTFSFTDLSISSQTSHDTPFRLNISVKVKNTGSRSGHEVVQVYVTLPDIGLTTPRLQLRGFAKVKDVAPGQSKLAEVQLDKYAVSYWDARRNVWAAKKGKYGIAIGKSSEDLVLSGEFNLEKDFEWTGL